MSDNKKTSNTALKGDTECSHLLEIVAVHVLLRTMTSGSKENKEII